MLEPGQQLGDFEVLAKLGHGGMGAVFKARQTVLRRLVAIKTLQPSLAADAEFVSRFHNEAVAAAGLNHPNLVQVYAAGQTDGIHWFAMEFVDGESVDSRLKRLGKLDPAEAVAICTHVCAGLEYGWRKAQLIHRDIKPDNIFLSKDGEVKLGDLGLAKSSDQQQGLTMTGASMGTPLYISPEQAEGRRDIDLRTDIYSLGATLYHLIAGAPPYTADSAISVMMKHVGAPVPDIRTIDSSIPAVLAAVILRMMQKAPEERYASYEHLGADLQGAYAALLEPPVVPAEDSGATRGESSGVTEAKRSLPKWLVPTVALPLVALGFFGALKLKGPSSGNKSAVSVRGSVLGDPVAELVRRLEAKLLPVPETKVSMCKTELTVGEWKLYLKANGLPEWRQPWQPRQADSNSQGDASPPVKKEMDWDQTDEHPVVISWDDAKSMCDWLSAQTGSEWRMPLSAEWERAAGASTYPWGNYFPPKKDDGNYAILEDGTRDPKVFGVDGIRGTASVGSFKPNTLGFYDLGGNVSEWMWDGVDARRGKRVRGGGWASSAAFLSISCFDFSDPKTTKGGNGVRLARVNTSAGSKEKTDLPAPPPTQKASASSGQSPLQELVRRLESKLIPLPGSQFRMSKTECTVGEWKLYLQEAGLPGWTQPDKEWTQNDEHPVVMVTWEDVTKFTAWLSAKTGTEWRLPKVSEWETAVGRVKYPWGDYFPPRWNDGNFCYLEDGRDDPLKVGVDQIKGTAPVASFKPNALGFYDLGGNAMEWMLDYDDIKKQHALRGCGWRDGQKFAALAENPGSKSHASNNIGFRLVQFSAKN